MSNMCIDSTDPSQHEEACQVSISEESALLDHSFDKILLEAIDEGLSRLGDSAKQAIYISLERSFNIKKQDIPNKIDHFAHAIEKIFEHSAKLIEIEIMKSLHEKVGDSFIHLPEQDHLEFADYVRSMRPPYR